MRGVNNYKRTEKERGEDLLLTIELRNKGFTFRQIAEHISSIRDYSLSFKQVHQSYAAAIKIKEPDELKKHREKGIELMDLIQDEAFDSWMKSKGIIKETTKKGTLNKGKAGEGNQIEKQEQIVKEMEGIGNPAYLAAIIKAEERKAKFLGTDAVKKIDVTSDGEKVKSVFKIGGKEIEFE